MGQVILSARQAGEKISRGEMTAQDYAAELISRIEAQAHLNCFISFDPEVLMAEAQRVDNLPSEARQVLLLCGVPIGIKDNIDVAGFATSAGTHALRRHRPRQTAPVVSKLLEAGAIVAGKLNMHELAFGITSNNGVFGPVRNPYDTSRMAGGSSGGNAAAIAAGLIPAALGTDTGGSTRAPAALCGIAGMRATASRYDQSGVVPISHTRDTVGPMARTVADLACLDGLLSGDSLDIEVGDLKGVRIGVPEMPFYDNLHPDIAAACRVALGKLKVLGAELVVLDMRDIPALTARVSGPVCFYEIFHDLPKYLKASGADCTVEDIIAGVGSPDVQGVFAAARGPAKVSEAEYCDVIDIHVPALRAAYVKHFEKAQIDAIAFPTTRLPAAPLGDDEETDYNGVSSPTFPSFVLNTDPAGNAGLPGVSIPIGLTSSGLPIGFEFDGLQGSDRQLLKIAAALESEMPALSPPPLTGVS